MPIIFGLLFAVLVLIAMLLFMGLAIVLIYLDLIIFALLFFVTWWLPLAVAALVVIVQTIRYRTYDIFQKSCQEAVHFTHIDEPDYLDYMAETEGPIWQEPISSTSRVHYYTLLSAPHYCSCMPCVFYSRDKRYRVLIYHTSWKDYFLYQKHTFLMRYERAQEPVKVENNEHEVELIEQE